MTKKITIISLVSALSFGSLVHAGAMGDQSSSCCSGFVALEGGYTLTSASNYNFNLVGVGTLNSIQSKQHYTGRLAAGAISMMDDFGFTGELGWGYYGRVTLNPAFVGFGDFSIRHTLTGFDALLGVAFIQPYYSLSFKAGALIQNMTTRTDTNITVGGVPFFNSGQFKSNQTAALPEIKLGAAYNIDTNWALTAAYMLAIGSTSNINGSFNVNTLEAHVHANSLNPTINSFLLGIQYTA